MKLSFIVYGRPEPQGSSTAHVIAGRAHITSANSKLKPFRSEVTRCALAALGCVAPMFQKHVPVRLLVDFTFRKPDSVPKRRTHCVVRPDLDKLTRAINDSLTGAVWHDDSQVVEIVAKKHYGPVEGAEITVEQVLTFTETLRDDLAEANALKGNG